jgi:hypothetical protein
MFEKEIKFIGDFCLNQVKNLGSTFTFEKILTTNIHPAIIRYVSAELDYMIYTDRRKLLQKSYFDYSGKEILEHFQKISGEIKRNKKISSDDLKKLIFQAVSFNANYLVRPRWSLTKLVFNEQPIISVEELQLMLNYLYYYEYFKKVLSAYLTKRNLVQISLTEFDLILNKIDRELFNSNQEQLIENSLASMGDFFNIGGVDKNLISSTAIEIFLKEKNMLELVFRLRKGIPEGVKKQYDKNEIKRILYSLKVEEKTKEEITKIEPEIEIEEDIKTEVGTTEEEQNLGELANKHADELDKADLGSFLSPEEEETLLSLYNEEIIESVEETFEELAAEETKIVEPFVDEISTVVEAETLDQTSDTEFEKVKVGFEKEIVQEMLRDFIGEEKSDTIKEDEIEKKLEELPESVSEEVLPKIESLENELLNIFENLDKIDNTPLPEEKVVEETIKALPLEEEIDRKEEQLTQIAEVDPLEEYLKSVNEIVFSDKKEKIEDVIDKNEIKNIYRQPEKIIEKKEKPAAERNNLEQTENKRRSIRPKDLFSYLRKKEIKKIVSFIFANDEEDFMNTAERIMDCHSYKEASEILKAVFTSYKISPYSKEAITFTNSVSNYFRQA